MRIIFDAQTQGSCASRACTHKRADVGSSAFGGKADILCSFRAFPLLTHLGHRHRSATRTGAPFPTYRVGRYDAASLARRKHEATRVHYGTRRRGSGLAIRGTRAAAGVRGQEPDDRIPLVGDCF
jgi:hypothetical protein